MSDPYLLYLANKNMFKLKKKQDLGTVNSEIVNTLDLYFGLGGGLC